MSVFVKSIITNLVDMKALSLLCSLLFYGIESSQMMDLVHDSPVRLSYNNVCVVTASGLVCFGRS